MTTFLHTPLNMAIVHVLDVDTVCNCNGGNAGKDEGDIVDINHLPIDSLEWKNQPTNTTLTFNIGPLQCMEPGKEQFNI